MARPLPKLIDQPWLTEFLSEKGFTRTSPNSFGNGRATLQFESQTLVATPGDEGKAWQSNLKGVPAEAVRGVLETFLEMPAFLPQAVIDRRAALQKSAEESLRVIAQSIRELPETESGRHLRQFLWSLYNGHHQVNLWSLKGSLDQRTGEAVTEVFSAWMQGLVSESTLRVTLVEAGELKEG